MLSLAFGWKEWRGATPVGIECLPCLQDIFVWLCPCRLMSIEYREDVRADVESAFKSAVQLHPKHPSVQKISHPITGGWDEQLVWDNFQVEDAKAILSISVCEDMVDSPAWHFDPKGNFSVKSAYKVAVMIRNRQNGKEAAASKAVSANNTVKFDWESIWKLKGDNKLRMFVWRLAHNSLPNRMKIHRVGVDLDTRCVICNRLDEDGGHVFLKCKGVKECWNILSLVAVRESLLGCKNPLEMLAALEQCEDDIQLKSLVLMWDWWDNRNKVNAGEARRTAVEVCHRVERKLIDFASLNKPEKPAKPPESHRWKKPPDDFVKINFDGAYDNATGKGAWGYIIRDHLGGFAAAGAGKSVHLRDPLHSETVACLAAVDGAIRLGANRVIFESDSSNLVKALNCNEYDRSEIGVLIKEARNLCTVNFQCFKFSFDRRTCNAVAHELAKYGVNSASADSFWAVYAPNCVTVIIASDIAVQEG